MEIPQAIDSYHKSNQNRKDPVFGYNYGLIELLKKQIEKETNDGNFSTRVDYDIRRDIDPVISAYQSKGYEVKTSNRKEIRMAAGIDTEFNYPTIEVSWKNSNRLSTSNWFW